MCTSAVYYLQLQQTRGRGFSLSVEISGSSDRVDSIDLNLDVSGIPVSTIVYVCMYVCMYV